MHPHVPYLIVLVCHLLHCRLHLVQGLDGNAWWHVYAVLAHELGTLQQAAVALCGRL